MKPKIVSLTWCLSLLLVAANEAPSLAQSASPFSYMYMGQSLLYPLSRTVGMPYNYGPYNANPFYSTNSYLRNFSSNGLPNVFPFTNATYGPWGYRNAGMMPGYFHNGNNQNAMPGAQDEPDNADPSANTMNSVNPYQSPPPTKTGKPSRFVPSSGGAPAGQAGGTYEPFGANAPGTSPFKAGTAGAGTGGKPISPMVPPEAERGAQPITEPGVQPGEEPGAQPVPRAAQNSNFNAKSNPGYGPSSGSNANSNHGPSSGSNANSNHGPSSGSNANFGHGSGSNPNPSPSLSPGQSISRPLAQGFINHLNGNYQGDMSKALGNADTRSWARAMGIIGNDMQDGSHLSGDRLEVINRVLKDDSLDPVSKLDTLRILLKKNSPATN